MTTGERGRQTRATQAQLLTGQERQIGLRGQEQRLLAGETGRQERLTTGERARQERATTRVRGEEQRALTRLSGEQTRLIALQQEAFRRYKEARDYQQSRQAYRA